MGLTLAGIRNLARELRIGDADVAQEVQLADACLKLCELLEFADENLDRFYWEKKKEELGIEIKGE